MHREASGVMESPQSNHKQPVQDLISRIQNQTKTAYDLCTGFPEQPRRGFVPIGAIEPYLSEHNFKNTKQLLTAVFAPDEVPVSPRDVANKCPRILCILVLIDQARFIGSFVNHGLFDEKLPLEHEHRHFPKDSRNKEFFKQFFEQQWQFVSPILEPHQSHEFDEEYILPFTKLEDPRGGSSAIVYKATVHSEHDQLAQPPSRYYALKVFKSPIGQFEREVNAFKSKSESSTRHVQGVIQFYGSFKYRETFAIVLEYAEGGTLEDFYRKQARPSSGEDLINFWKALLATSTALWKIHDHHLNPDDGKAGMLLHGWHYDLKPENILIVRNEKSPYGWEFKIADLGSSFFREIKEGEPEQTALNAVGTRTYGAPECYSPSRSMIRERRRVTQSVDVWSLGAIYSEAVVWAVGDKVALSHYRRERKKETDRLSDFRDGNCFHDGTKLLDTVEEQHESIRDSFRYDDFISGKILDKMVDDMLEVNPENRPTAEDLIHRAKKCVEKATEALRRFREQEPIQPPPRARSPSAPVQSTRWGPSTGPTGHDRTLTDSDGRILSRQSRIYSSPQQTRDFARPLAHPFVDTQQGAFAAFQQQRQSIRQPPPRQRSPTDTNADIERLTINTVRPSTDSEPYLSVKDLLDWWLKVSADRSSAKLPHEEKWFWELKGREHVFIVDDSLSMAPHWNQLVKLVQALAKLLKRYDPNKLELYFLGSDKTCVSKRSSELSSCLRNHTPDKMTNLNYRLDADLRKYREAIDRSKQPRSRMSQMLSPGKELNKRSVYVFTDGVLESGEDEQGHESIVSMVKKLIELDLPRDQIGIQFIRFGDSEKGRSRLEFLDNISHTYGLGKDIIDTEPADGNVCKMLLGAINPKFDGDPKVVVSPTYDSPEGSSQDHFFPPE